MILDIVHIVIEYVGYDPKLMTTWDDCHLGLFYKNYTYVIPFNKPKTYKSDMYTVCHHGSGLTDSEVANVCKKFRKLDGIWSPDFIHDRLTEARFCWSFNQPITLPFGLRRIEFKYYFNQPIGLPETLEVVIFGYSFNHPVELPANLHTVVFGYRFNHRVRLPANLQKLEYHTSRLFRIATEHGGELVPRRLINTE